MIPIYIVYNEYMPYNYTHALLGQKAREHCEINTCGMLAQQEDFFLLGTMGPDAYFGDVLLPPVGRADRLQLPDRLHKQDGKSLFGALLAYAQADDSLFAYALGFLTHFLLDNHTHPYIIARFPGKEHSPAEIAIEMLMTEKQEDACYRVKPSRFYNRGGVASIDALLARVNWKLFALRTEGCYPRSIKKWLGLGDLQFDPHGRKRVLLKPFKFITKYLLTPGVQDAADMLNERHAPWGRRDAKGNQRTQSFLELFEAAREEATVCLDMAVSLRGKGDYGPLLDRFTGRTADAAESL